jgi:hypothetical protein
MNCGLHYSRCHNNMKRLLYIYICIYIDTTILSGCIDVASEVAGNPFTYTASK